MRPRWYSSNPSEQAVGLAFERDGWKVYRSGWPDFLMERDGAIRAVEVKRFRTFTLPDGRPHKSPHSKLSPEQRRVHRLLRQFGMDVRTVMVADTPEGWMPVEMHGSVRNAERVAWYEITRSGP